MPKINVLSKNVAELIAAGEVIERPASVIKELVENSIDSGADNITVEIQNGGISFMRVTDNGCGISQEDIPAAFLRHATSKVLSEDDLNSISTMGFRGEALASISAVARVEMLSKQPENNFGASYKIEGGTEISLSETGCPDGTTIIIKDLFFNTPARLKFLKKDVSEGNSIASIVDKLAIAHPEISFRFIRDNKPVRITPGGGELYTAVYSVFGKQFAASLIPVEYDMNGIIVNGYISSPLFPRANRTMQYFFVNSRYVRSSSCTAAVEEGCRNSIMTGKFPACVINIDIDPTEVDVNVHPAKTEVRFSNDRLVFDSVYFAVKNAVLNADNNKVAEPPKPIYIPQPSVEIHEAKQYQLNSFTASYKTENIKKPAVDVTPKKSKYEQRLELPEKNNVLDKSTTSEQIEINNVHKNKLHETHQLAESNTDNPINDCDEIKINENEYKFINEQSLKKNINNNKEEFGSNKIYENNTKQNTENNEYPLNVIGELWKTYIICENGEQFILIDKHAAHERIRFEKLQREFVSTSQLLVESIFIEIEGVNRDALLNNKEILLDAGIEILDAGIYKIEITSIPSSLVGTDMESLLNDLANIFISGGNDVSVIFDEILHSIACRGAIKANDVNNINDLKKLAIDVWYDKSIRFCPHGRPIITVMSKTEIEKNFKRIT